MIRGSKRDIPNQQPAASFGIHNRFDIEVIDVETGRIKKEARAYNVICDQLWTRLFSKQAYFTYIQYGSGDGVPSTGDKSLFKYVSAQSAESATTTIDYAKGVFSATRRIQLAAATSVGVTITEVGIAYYNDSSSLCTHAMLEDMNGNRVSITKSDTDVINIYATVYVHFNPRGYDNGSIRPITCVGTRGIFAYLAGLGVELPDRMYITEYDTANVTLMAYGARPSGQLSGSTVSSVSVSVRCDETTKTITFTPIRLEANAHNIGGLRYLNLWRYSYGSISDLYEPWCIVRPGGDWFPHSVIASEAVGTGDGSTVDYSLKFPFASNVKVYIDGVETTDFVCEYAPNTATYFGLYMEELHPDSSASNHICKISTGYEANTPYVRVFYNPAYEVGAGQITCYTSTEVYASDDLIAWDLVRPATAAANSYGSNSTTSIPSEYANRKYWKAVNALTYGYTTPTFKPPATFTGKTLHFNTPPAEGAVITADYKTDTIAKDANHVFDFSLTIKLGEYVES